MTLINLIISAHLHLGEDRYKFCRIFVLLFCLFLPFIYSVTFELRDIQEVTQMLTYANWLFQRNIYTCRRISQNIQRNSNQSYIGTKIVYVKLFHNMQKLCIVIKMSVNLKIFCTKTHPSKSGFQEISEAPHYAYKMLMCTCSHACACVCDIQDMRSWDMIKKWK